MTQIRIILTAALSSNHQAFRKNQYLESFRSLQRLGLTKDDIYIVEALKKTGPTFLDEYSSHVYYAQNNNASFKNNGINEAITLLEALDYFKFDDDDIIIKLTGRHQLTSNEFLQIIEANPNYDMYIKINPDGAALTLTFAMRCQYMKEMYSSMNLNAMGYSRRAIEHEVARYIKLKTQLKILYVQTLHVKADVFGSTTCPGMTGTFYF